MTVTLGTNVASLRAQRQLIQTGETLGTVFERLSSGQRINRASDDAAGLAIASSLNADTRVFTQAVRNANDGLSMLSIGDGALLELTNITIRLSELAEQSANGTFSSVQRESLHEEGVALVDEYNRIVESTRFGKKDLFRVEDLNTRLQLGYGLDGSLEVSLGEDLARQAGDGSFQARTTIAGADGVAIEGFDTGDFNGDGNLDIVTAGFVNERAYVQLGNGDGTFGAVTTYDNIGGRIITADMNGDGHLDLLGHAYGGTGSVRLLYGNGDGTFQDPTILSGFGSSSLEAIDYDGDGDLDLFGASSSNISLIRSNGDGTFQAAEVVGSGYSLIADIDAGDLNKDGLADLVLSDRNGDYFYVLNGTTSGSFEVARSFYLDGVAPIQIADLDNDDNLDFVTVGGGTDRMRVVFGNGDGTYDSTLSFSTPLAGAEVGMDIGDINGDGILDIVHATYGAEEEIRVFEGLGNREFSDATILDSGGSRNHFVRLDDVDNDGAVDILHENRINRTISIHKGNVRDIMTILDFDLRTQSSSLSAMADIVEVRDRILEERSAIGAQTSRVEVAISNLFSARENYTAAESRILDADIADESATLVRTNILQQAASSVLAQANQQPALALQLLG